MTECGVDSRPAMVTTPTQLALALDIMAGEFPDIHAPLADALGRAMRGDGVMEFTVSELAKDSGVRLGLTKEYLGAGRRRGLLAIVGRRTDNGRIRYCAYRITGGSLNAQAEQHG